MSDLIPAITGAAGGIVGILPRDEGRHLLQATTRRNAGGSKRS
jgi:hypothetical protein